MAKPEQLSNGKIRCHNCKNTYDRVGYHWSQGKCDYPALPEHAQERLTGLMMGDGTLRRQTSSPFVQLYMTNQPFLEWLDSEFGWLSTGVSLYRTAERSAELSRENGSNPGADAEDYHDVFVLQTRTHPDLAVYEDWYEGDGKTIPDDLDLSREIARMWYACDGSLVFDRRYPNSRPHINLSVGAEMANGNIENVKRLFAESDFHATPTVDAHTIRFTADESEAFLDWMGDPPAGFSYKWSRELRQYERRRDAALSE